MQADSNMKIKENLNNTDNINKNTIIEKHGCTYYYKINDKINNILNFNSYYKTYHCNYENYNIYKYFNNDTEIYKKEWMKNSVLRQMIASGIGTGLCILTLNPISVIKLRVQRTDLLMENTVMGAVKTIYQKGGIRGFWAGAQIGLAQSIPSSVIYMTAYEKFKYEINQNCGETVKPFGPGIAGGFARCWSVTLIAPLELIRTIVTGGKKESGFKVAQHIYKTEGLVGFYRGWSSTIYRDAPFSAIYWLSYERLKTYFSSIISNKQLNPSYEYNQQLNHQNSYNTNIMESKGNTLRIMDRNDSHFITFLSGASAGVLSAVLTHPFDVLKTQQQLSPKPINNMDGITSRNSSESTQKTKLSKHEILKYFQKSNFFLPNNSSHTKKYGILDIFRERGFKGLFKGLTMRLLTVIPSSAIMVTVYEGIKKIDI